MTPREYTQLVRRVRRALTKALESGEIEPSPCFICGDPAAAHHHDYTKPLSVWWLCPKHHRWQHAGRPRGTQFLGQLDAVKSVDKPQPLYPDIAPHGTVARYQSRQFPCRCVKCRDKWRLYKKLYRRRRKIEFGEQAAALRKQGRFAESEVVLVAARTKS